MGNTKGFFITFEGGEAVGKSSLINMVYDALCDNKYDVIITREPGGSDYGEEIRQLIFHKRYTPSHMTELLLMFAARRDHIERVIAPALANNKIILCDRYIDSSYVYQSYLNNVDPVIIDRLCQDFVAPYYPDHSYFIHTDTENTLKRLSERGIQNRNDDIDHKTIQKLSDAYLKQAKLRDNITVIHNNDNIDASFNSILNDIKKRISI